MLLSVLLLLLLGNMTSTNKNINILGLILLAAAAKQLGRYNNAIASEILFCLKYVKGKNMKKILHIYIPR